MTARLVMLLIGLLTGMVFGASVGAVSWMSPVQLKALKVLMNGEPDPTALPGYRELVDQFSNFAGPADLVMFGDSITALGEWPELLPGLRIANRGIGGDVLQGMLKRMNVFGKGQPAQPGSGKPRVFVMAGINDIMMGRPVDAVISDYQKLADGLAGIGELTIQSTLPIAAVFKGFYGATETNKRVGLVNEAMRQYAAKRGYRFLDLGTGMSEANVLGASYTIDGIHLTAKGYLQWRDALQAVLK